MRWLQGVTVCLLVAGFYYWAVAPQPRTDFVTAEASDYHGLLTRGFLKGQLAMDVDVDPALAALNNPWDPAERAGRGLADASYYEGRYHLYFGVTPIVLLFLPFRLITGHYLGEAFACLLFAWVALGFSWWLLRLLRRHFFPRTSAWVETACLLALGFVPLVGLMLRRPSMWEVPITAGHALFMLALVCLVQAFRSPRRHAWLAGCSAALALAVGCRHTYLLAFIAPLFALRFWAPDPKPNLAAWWSDRIWRRSLIAIVVPAAAIGFGLALYNVLRFGDPTEFGQSYQLSSADLSKTRFFGWDFFWFGSRVYLWEPAGWSPFFPFVTVIDTPPLPAGYYGVENPYGIFPNLPFVWLALPLLVFFRRKTGAADPALVAYTRAVALAVTVLALTLMAYFGLANRYMIYFVPGIVLLACIGWLTLESQAWYRGPVRVVGSVGILVLLAYSIAFNVLVAIQHNHLLRINHPSVYKQLARAGNRLASVVDPWWGTEYGPVELELIFPAERDRGAEPILVTGSSFLADYVYVLYGRNSVRFGFEHTSYGGFTSAPLRITPGRIYRVRVEMGSLYPPAEHPYFDGMNVHQMHRRRQVFRLAVDDTLLLQRVADFYDATERVPAIGNSKGRPGFTQPFSGQVVSWRRAPEAAPVVEDAPYGPVRFELVVPAFTLRRSEPLLSTGEPGRGDLVYVSYLSSGRVSIGHDHWGLGGPESAPIAAAPGEVLIVEIDSPALYRLSSAVAAEPRAERVIVRVNGRPVLSHPGPVYPATAESVVVGRNPLGFTTAGTSFTGVIQWVSRLPEPLPVPEAPP